MPSDDRATGLPTEGEPGDAMVAPPGRFRLYLGAAAGVGKTCAMLDEGWRRRERGRDVVVGFVETHGRPHTAEFVRDLEVVPRKTVDYRGTQFEEMDLDRVLARDPQVALVDELAHTNVPGSGRHGKRWEDVLELLENGIGVISTVNIQHLESLAPSIEAMTGTTVRERVPDWVVRRADQTELVDSSPEQLRRRLVHGNVYPEAQVPSALTHFFTTRNLTILRELALRFVADETEESLLRGLQNSDLGRLETGEHILVGVTTRPGTDQLLRRAARITSRSKGDLHVAHVVAADATRGRDPRLLAELEALSLALGATWSTLQGDSVASALVAFAREHQITQLMVGSDPERRWGLGRGGVLKEVLRECGQAALDVHVISLARERETARSEDPGGG
ncbi:MAG TPA: sensor histidine kinase KdpD [Candidatus Dormibacteraeota bacterium]